MVSGFFRIYIGKMRYNNYHYMFTYNLKPFELEFYSVNGFDYGNKYNSPYKTIFKIIK